LRSPAVLARVVEQRLSFKARETRVPGNGALVIGQRVSDFRAAHELRRVVDVAESGNPRLVYLGARLARDAASTLELPSGR